jgi:Dolichyl-phosphate-mannose-protein mannosyltransferase
MPETLQPPRSPRSSLLLVGALTAAGLFLRLPSFNSSIFGDELSTYFIVTGHSLGHVIYLLQDHSVDLNPPLSFVLAWISERLGDSAQLVRLPSLLAGTAAIPFTYLLGVRTVGSRAALVGATLMALSPFSIFYSSEARAYALLMLLVLIAAYTLVRGLQTGRNRWWVAYGACSCAAFYTHYVAVFPLVALFVLAFWTAPKARRMLITADLAAAIGTVPWLPTFLKETHSPGVSVTDFLTPFTLHNVRIDLGQFSLGYPLRPLAFIPGYLALALMVGGLAAATLGLAVELRAGRRARPPSRGMSLVAVFALAPPVGIALYSWVAPHTIWNANMLICCLPGLALAVGSLVTSSAALVQLVAAALLIGGFAIATSKTLQTDSQRPDYQAAASFIDRTGHAGDPVLDAPAPTPGPLTALDVALSHTELRGRRRHVVLRLGYPPLEAILRAPPYSPVPVTAATAVKDRAERIARGRNLFVVAFGDRTSVASVTAAGGIAKRFRLVETRTFAGFTPVSVAVFRGY